MAGKLLALTTLLILLTACRQQQLSLPITHAAGVEAIHSGAKRSSAELDQPPSLQSCYSYMLMRPKSQRAVAVQARLRKVDQLAAAFHSRRVTVDLVGDHANILSLQFPVASSAHPSYSDRISAIVEDYLSTPEIQDYMCDSGFAEVRLSALGLKDRRVHPVWTARITTEGLQKVAPAGQVANNSVPAVKPQGR